MRAILTVAIFVMFSLLTPSIGARGETPSPAPTRWIYCFAGVGSQEKAVEYFSHVFSNSDAESVQSYYPKFVDFVVKTQQEDKDRLVGACSANKTKDEAASEMESNKKDFDGYQIVDANWP